MIYRQKISHLVQIVAQIEPIAIMTVGNVENVGASGGRFIDQERGLSRPNNAPVVSLII